MDRITRLFSRKVESEEQASSDEGRLSIQDKTAPQADAVRREGDPTQAESRPGEMRHPASPTVENTVAVENTAVKNTADQDFGLKFIFDSGEVKTFQSLPISIGRSEQNDIILGDPTVSARHVRVYYDDKIKEICIMDNDSLNGLFINEQPTRRNILLDDMKIRLGNVNLVFRDTGYIHRTGSEGEGR